MTGIRRDRVAGRHARQYLPDVSLALQNLGQRKLRSLLTMLGMIFGVGAVVSMMSIGAGAQQQVMAFIEQLGVRNLIVEAKEVTDSQEYQRIRKLSPGLTRQDLRVIRTNIAGLSASTARKRVAPSSILPKPRQDAPVVYGVAPEYQTIAGLGIATGRFFTDAENDTAAPVCVLGTAAKANLFPEKDALGQYIKINLQWYRVVGILDSQLTSQNAVSGLKSQDLNNLILAPLDSVMFRLEDTRSYIRDEIDGLYLQMSKGEDLSAIAGVVRGILNSSHRNAGDFSLVVPAELLAEQKRTQQIFEMVMVSIASISLLVGGIGIMNIMLASILERTHEIGVRRAVGARRSDILRQFLVEATLISLVGGLLGIGCGIGISRLVALMAEWSTIVTLNSILLAFLVSASVGLVFGIYPAAKAARLDPVEALRYE
jgi:putative ABC transport system permease protein